MTLAYGLLEE